MIVGVMAVFYLGANVMRFVLDGELRALLGRRQLQSRISKMENHFVVCGFGRMGKALCEALGKKGAGVVCIDTNHAKIEEAHGSGYLYIEGDAMLEDVLEQARVGRACGLAACLPKDSDNVFVALTARALNPKLTIVAKANYEATHSQLRASLMVVAVVHEDGRRSFNPSPTMHLAPGDELIVIGAQGGVGKMTGAYGTEG